MSAESDADAIDSGQAAPEAVETDAVAPDANRAAAERTAIEEAAIGFDQLFEILKNQRRREVIRYVIDADEEVTLSTLAEALAAQETGKDVAQITSQERKRVYVGLYQCHLPKMDDYGAIEYNKPRGRIESGEHTHRFERYLSVEEDEGDAGTDWTQMHSVLTIAVAALLGGPLLVGAAGPNAALQVGVALVVGALVGGALFHAVD
jgi:hypothetical protein